MTGRRSRANPGQAGSDENAGLASVRRPRLVNVFVLLVLSALAAAVLIPIFVEFNSAFKDDVAFRNDRLGLAIPPNFDGMIRTWSLIDVPRSFLNSVVVSCATVLGVWVAGSLAGYAFTFLRLRGGTLIFLFLVGSLMVPVQVVLTPLFLVMHAIGLVNTLPGLILAEVAFQLPVATFLFASYFKRLPSEVIEAAAVDGATSLVTLRHVVLPMSLPALATIGTLSFVGSWNELLLVIIVITDRALGTLTARAAQLQGTFLADPVVTTAAVVFAMAPMILVFLFAQRWLIRAVTVGGVR